MARRAADLLDYATHQDGAEAHREARMDSVLDAITAIVGRAAESWLGIFALTSPIWLLAVVRIWQALQRRRAFRDFAAARHLQFVGTIPSDARAPYTRIERVRREVLLSNVMEGQWDGLPIRLFDIQRGRAPRWTMVLVTVEGTLRRGAGAEHAIAAGPTALIETNLDVLCVSPRRALDASELATWLSFATTLAQAMERDAKEEAAIDVSEEAPPPARAMFGRFSGE
jgi:hypothetical protein